MWRRVMRMAAQLLIRLLNVPLLRGLYALKIRLAKTETCDCQTYKSNVFHKYNLTFINNITYCRVRKPYETNETRTHERMNA